MAEVKRATRVAERVREELAGLVSRDVRDPRVRGAIVSRVVMTDDLSKVADAVAIGQRTMTVAVQSIWLGIGLSLVLMGVAAFGFIPAILGATTQEVVDLASRAVRRPA